MANPAVEKIKNLGIRHGEKVGVALVAALCLVFVVMAWSRESIDLTPDQIKKTAEAAQSNLNRPQSDEDIIERLDQDGLVPPEFVEQVARAQQEQNEPVKLAFAGPPFTYPEPGAGLIREMPKLLAPVDLFATPGRGGVRVFKTDEKGELVFEKPEEKKPKPKKKSSRSRNSSMMVMDSSGMSGMSGPTDGMTEEERKKKREEDHKRLMLSLAGTPKAEVVDELGSKAQAGLMPAETTAGYRWVSLVGKIDHQAMRDNYAAALKVPDGNPNYLRLDAQRRELLDPDNDQWSDWETVDREYNQTILAYVTREDEELAPEDVRLEGLVDMLPFLQIGDWRGAHYAPLIPAEKLAMPEPPAGGMMGMGSSMMGESMMDSSMMGMDSSMMMSESMMGMDESMMMNESMMGMGMGNVEANFPKSTAPELMVRMLDFSVIPDTAYQYRLSIVVANPNLGREDVKPGTDIESEELSGPWSEPTEPVRVPADVTTYAMGPSPSDPNAIRFQVASFDEKTGLTVVDEFDQKPGDIIGESRYRPVPKEDGDGVTRNPIDFTSRQILLDTSGGKRPLDALGKRGTTFDSPALGVVMRADGTLLLRDQTHDAHDPEMKQMREIYNQILADAEEGGKEPPENGMMDMYSEMMGY